MTIPCRGCPFVDDPLAEKVRRLHQVGRELNIVTQLPLREGDAARLIGRSGETLRDWRKGLSPDEAPLRYRKDPRGGVRYSIEDVAAFLIAATK